MLFASTTASEVSPAPPPPASGVSLAGVPFVGYTPETGFAGGAIGFVFFRTGATEEDVRRSSVAAAVVVTEKGQFQAGIFPEIYAFGDRFVWVGNYRGARYPLDFYGVGPGARDADRETYTPDYLKASTDLRVRLAPHFYVGLAHDFDTTRMRDLDDSGAIGRGTVIGARGGTTSGLGPELVYDSRDHLNYPRHGTFAQATFIGYGRGFGSDYAFSQLTLDARAYQSIGERHTITEQLYAIAGSSGAPFYMLAQLGGPNLLRGYYMGRFRDDSMVILEAEYRVRIVWRIGAAAFFGVGETAHDLPDFWLDPHLRPAGGGGLRFVLSEKEQLTVRFDVGVSETGVLPYALAQEAW